MNIVRACALKHFLPISSSLQFQSFVFSQFLNSGKGLQVETPTIFVYCKFTSKDSLTEQSPKGSTGFLVWIKKEQTGVRTWFMLSWKARWKQFYTEKFETFDSFYTSSIWSTWKARCSSSTLLWKNALEEGIRVTFLWVGQLGWTVGDWGTRLSAWKRLCVSFEFCSYRRRVSDSKAYISNPFWLLCVHIFNVSILSWVVFNDIFPRCHFLPNPKWYSYNDVVVRGRPELVHTSKKKRCHSSLWP
jgi:hypothetical protein